MAAIISISVILTFWSNGNKKALPQPLAVAAVRDTSVPSEPIAIAGAPTRGAAGARVAIIEFSDFECRYCGSMARDTMPLVEAKYVATGRLLVVFKHLPLEPIHQAAARAGAAAECAARQDAFWDMHDELFLSQQRQLDERGLLRRVDALGLNHDEFLRCLDTDGRQRVADDVGLAKSIGIASTPTYLIGELLPDRRVQVRHRLAGSVSAETLGTAIDDTMVREQQARVTEHR